MQRDLTHGPIGRDLLLFAVPLILGDLLQQFYNVADTWVVGRFLGGDALAAVGSSYTLMVFLTSILLGLSMGSGAAISIQYGSRALDRVRRSVFLSFVLIAALTAALNVAVFLLRDPLLVLLRVPAEVRPLMGAYLQIVFCGIGATFLYNYFACLLRAVGESVVPLVFLAVSSVLNVGLDLLFVLGLHWGVRGAALATVLAQWTAAVGLVLYALRRFGALLLPRRADRRWDRSALSAIVKLSLLTCLQQSLMNFGILMIQGLVNSFGAVVMAGFAAAVKIDSFAYMPVQDFGNAFSTFVAQNHGAGRQDRIRQGIRCAGQTVLVFCLAVSLLIVVFARPLMALFVGPEEEAILAAGVHYLRIEGACYLGIGILFLLYGYYRAIDRPGMSVLLTVASLGTRVALAYALAPLPAFGVTAIWAAVPIGWALADAIGIGWYLRRIRPAQKAA